MNPFRVSAAGKGIAGMLKRLIVIGSRYGLTTASMDRLLAHFTHLLSEFNCGATFPITTVTLAHNKNIIKKYQAQNIEFAAHGYLHVDHTQLSPDVLRTHIQQLQRVFRERDIQCTGFRFPYLRWSDETLEVISESGFLYEGSQGIAWDVTHLADSPAYRHVLNFYGAIPARDFPSLPRIEDGLVRIPYCLPDDEALIERFQLTSAETMTAIWLSLLEHTYAEGELFTLGLHPERIHLCETPLVETLRRARSLSPHVWIARLDEIARWWKARSQTRWTLLEESPAQWLVRLAGPDGLTVLARNVETVPAALPWDSAYRRVPTLEFQLRSERQPWLGVAPRSSPDLKQFLRQQGYIFEESPSPEKFTFYLDRPTFEYRHERPLLTQIEHNDFPLLKTGRWPHAAHSALSVSGDIDALTLWDYGLRLIER
jgi:hypothetical protein